MIIATSIFLFVSTMIVLRTRALRTCARVEAGTFAGLAAEIERVCAQGVQDRESVEGERNPIQLAA